MVAFRRIPGGGQLVIIARQEKAPGRNLGPDARPWRSTLLKPTGTVFCNASVALADLIDRKSVV